MKLKLIISFLLILTLNQGFAIGFPHGYSKKKTIEPIENTRKESKIEKKISAFKSTISIVIETIVALRK